MLQMKYSNKFTFYNDCPNFAAEKGTLLCVIGRPPTVPAKPAHFLLKQNNTLNNGKKACIKKES